MNIIDRTEAATLARTGAMRRAIARQLAGAKPPATRARYAVKLAGRLARGSHPFWASCH